MEVQSGHLYTLFHQRVAMVGGEARDLVELTSERKGVTSTLIASRKGS